MHDNSQIEEVDRLFHNGVAAFNDRQFYEAHEYWEEIWLDFKLQDALFIQGLIQLAVCYFHLFNKNHKGARSMLKKCLGKFERFDLVRGINVLELKSEIEIVQKYLNNININDDISGCYIIKLKVIHE